MNIKCLFKGHDLVPVENTEDHIAGTGWWMVCTRCRKWVKMR